MIEKRVNSPENFVDQVNQSRDIANNTILKLQSEFANLSFNQDHPQPDNLDLPINADRLKYISPSKLHTELQEPLEEEQLSREDMPEQFEDVYDMPIGEFTPELPQQDESQVSSGQRGQGS